MFKVFQICNIFISNIISNNITFMHMLKLANSRLNLSFIVKGHKTENNAFFL